MQGAKSIVDTAVINQWREVILPVAPQAGTTMSHVTITTFPVSQDKIIKVTGSGRIGMHLCLLINMLI